MLVDKKTHNYYSNKYFSLSGCLVLWLVSSGENFSLSLDDLYSNYIIYGSKKLELAVNLLQGNVEAVHTIEIKKNLVLSELACLITKILPEDAIVAVNNAPWLTEMLSVLRNCPLDAQAPAIIPVDLTNQQQYDFSRTNLAINVIKHELICDLSDHWFSGCYFVNEPGAKL